MTPRLSRATRLNRAVGQIVSGLQALRDVLLEEPPPVLAAAPPVGPPAPKPRAPVPPALERKSPNKARIQESKVSPAQWAAARAWWDSDVPTKDIARRLEVSDTIVYLYARAHWPKRDRRKPKAPPARKGLGVGEWMCRPCGARTKGAMCNVCGAPRPATFNTRNP